MIHREGAQQETVFPTAFIDPVSEVAVKGHNLLLKK
jgi:hypothetical protein